MPDPDEDPIPDHVRAELEACRRHIRDIEELLAHAVSFRFPTLAAINFDSNAIADQPIEVVYHDTVNGPTQGLSPQHCWAVKQLDYCWNNDGEWEDEPIPSSRDKAFLDRCRFTRDEAIGIAVELTGG